MSESGSECDLNSVVSEMEYVVDHILAYRFVQPNESSLNRQVEVEFLVRWEDFSHEHDCWINWEDFTDWNLPADYMEQSDKDKVRVPDRIRDDWIFMSNW